MPVLESFQEGRSGAERRWGGSAGFVQREIDALSSKDVVGTESFHRFKGETGRAQGGEKHLGVIKCINNISFRSFLT